MTLAEELEAAAKELRKPWPHYYCEDSWYSCPQAEDGCADDRRGPECDCGAVEITEKRKGYADLLDRAAELARDQEEVERYDCPLHGLQDGPECPRC